MGLLVGSQEVEVSTLAARKEGSPHFQDNLLRLLSPPLRAVSASAPST